jgi:hypothetical protein
MLPAPDALAPGGGRHGGNSDRDQGGAAGARLDQACGRCVRTSARASSGDPLLLDRGHCDPAAGALRGGLGGSEITSTSVKTNLGYVYQAFQVVFQGCTSALALRLLSDPGANWLRFDRPLLECVGLLVFAQSLSTGLGLLGAQMAAAGGARSMSGWLWSIGGNIVLLLLSYAWAKLMLFPVARLEGRDDISLHDAWRMMRRTVRSYVGAWVIVGIPFLGPLYAAYAALHVNPKDPAPAYVVLSTVVTAAMGLVNSALIMAVYRKRVKEGRDVAEVFD